MKNKLMKTSTLVISILFVIVGVFATNFSIFSKSIDTSRAEIDTVLSNLSAGLFTNNGVLSIDDTKIKEREFLLGNRNVLILIDETKEIADNEFKKYLIEERVKHEDAEFIIYFTKDKVIYHTQLGWEAYSYSEFETSEGTNLLDGYTLLNLSKINEYVFENVPLLVLDSVSVFLISIVHLLLIFTFFVFGFDLPTRTKRNNKSM